jgi:hypothetical protein
MNALRRNRLTRSMAVLVFLLGVLTVSLTAVPEPVSASCGFEYYWAFYDEWGNLVGEAWGYCGGPFGSWGSWTPDRQGYSVECPCWP